jgi:magnesium transporter
MPCATTHVTFRNLQRHRKYRIDPEQGRRYREDFLRTHKVVLKDGSPPSGNGTNTTQANSSNAPSGSQRPTETLNSQSTSNAVPLDQGEQPAASRRKRTHRGGKKKRNRRQSFAAPSDDVSNVDPARSNHDLLDVPSSSAARPPFTGWGNLVGNLSNTSLDSEVLLDHRYGFRIQRL